MRPKSLQERRFVILSIRLTYRPHYARLPTWTGIAVRIAVEEIVHGPGLAGPVEAQRRRRRRAQPRLRSLGRRAFVGGLLALLTACSGTSELFNSNPSPAGAGAAAGRDRHRRGQGRPDPAAVGRRQRRHRGAVDEERRRDGAGRIQQPQRPASGQGRRRHLGRRAAGGAAGARRGRRDHHRAAVRAFGRRRRRGRPPARRAGDRVLDRRQRRGARRLSPELPAGIRRRSHRRLRHRQRQAVVRRHAVGGRLRQRGRSRVQAGGGAQGRAHRRARTLRARSGPDAGAGEAGRAGGARRGCGVHSRGAGGGAARWRRP